MLRVVWIRLVRCTLSPFQASRTRTLHLPPQRRYNREQQRDSSSNSKRLQPRLSRAPARVQNQLPLCLATSLHKAFNARTRCRIRTDRRVVIRTERRWDRSALDLEDPPVWLLMRRGIRRLPLRRGHRCRDSLHRCVWASLVLARDNWDEVGRFKVIGRMRAAESPPPSPTIWFEKYMKECSSTMQSADKHGG